VKISDSITVEKLFDYKNGRRFQILILNKVKDEHYTSHKDMMGRDYIKMKLTEPIMMALLTEIRKNMILSEEEAKLLNKMEKRSKLKLVGPGDESDGT
jgi:hypothetical protein